MCYGEGRGVVPPPEFVQQGRYPEFIFVCGRGSSHLRQSLAEPNDFISPFILPFISPTLSICYIYILAGHKIT